MTYFFLLVSPIVVIAVGILTIYEVASFMLEAKNFEQLSEPEDRK